MCCSRATPYCIDAAVQDVQKALWNMHHVLREDPQRRHTFAFTIENRTLRMWFASRSEIVVSEPVDFFKVGRL